MTGMSPERLADIRERHATGLGRERPGDVAYLLREVDRLRSALNAIRNGCDTLLNPTEGDNDE